MGTVCRLCAKQKSSKQLAHSIDDRTLNIEQKLIDCCRWTSIVATENEALPKKICSSCYRKLDMSWSFAESVAQAQQQIVSKYVDTNDTAVKEEPLEINDIGDPNAPESPKHQPKDISPNDKGITDDAANEPAKNTRPKREPKPAMEKYQGDFGNNKAKPKGNGKQAPRKKPATKTSVPEKSRKPLQPLPAVKYSACNKCGNKFGNADLLKNHMKIHDEAMMGKGDEKKYECKTCGKRFKGKDKLKVSK